MSKVSIIGVGKVGGLLTHYLLQDKKISELVLIDIVKEKVEGLVEDLSDGFPDFAYKLKIGEYSDTAGSDIIVVAAGIPRQPDTKTRMDLLAINKNIYSEFINKLGFDSDTIFINVTNPVEPLGYYLLKQTKQDPKKVIGFGNILDTERLKLFISQKLNIPPSSIDCLVIGEHGEEMIPIFSLSKINGRPLSEFGVDLDEIQGLLRGRGPDIIRLLGGTQFGPAYHTYNLITSILDDQKKIYPISFYLNKNKFYGLENVFISLPAQVGRSGIEKAVEIDISDQEKNHLLLLAEKLRTIQQLI